VKEKKKEAPDCKLGNCWDAGRDDKWDKKHYTNNVDKKKELGPEI